MRILGWFVGGAVPVGAALLFVPRELWRRWRSRLVDYLDKALWRRVSRFDHRYREFVLRGVRFVDLKGLATVGFYTPELDEVYVDVSLVHRPPHQVAEDVLASPPVVLTDRHSIERFIDDPQSRVLAVIGVPGSGKTTLLRHTARVICRDGRSRRRTVPILLYLRDHVEAIVSNPDIALPALVRITLGRHAAAEPPGWLEQRLVDGACVVLLDGLDEVSRLEERRIVAGWVEDQARQYPDNDYVITSRPHGYRTTRIDGAVVVQVRGFTDEQVNRFVRRWYLAVEEHSTEAASDEVRAESAADDLLRRLSRTPALYDLAVNPLLLTMIANVHNYRGTLPGSRADLYDEICQVMLWRRQEAKKLPVGLSGDKKETLLRGLAFAMMERRVRDLSRDDALDELRLALRRMPAPVTPAEFLAEACRYGLLIERESGLYSFAHLTFQESLAAAHIRAKGLTSVLVDAVDDPWWRETTLLYVAQSDADPIVQACLESSSVTALSLAFDCAEQSNDLAPELRLRLHELLESEQDDRRRAAIMVTRHLRDRIDGVCTRPISTAIYQQYLRMTGNPPPDNPYLDEDEPITGVRCSDAVSFVDWVNQLTSGETQYRLPSHDDLGHPAVRRMIPPLCAWTNSTELWVPPGADHPGRIDAETLTQHIDQDLERAAPLFARLGLIRSIIRIRDDIHYRNSMSHGVWLQDHSRVLRIDVRAGDLIAGDLDRVLSQDLALAHDVDQDLTAALDGVSEVRDAVSMARFAANRVHGPLIDPDAWNDRESIEQGSRELSTAGRRALDLASDLVAGLGERAANSGEVIRTLETSAWRRMLLRTFGDDARVVSLDAVADDAQNGRRNLIAHLGSAPGARWAAQVTRRLADHAVPVCARQRPLTVDLATRIRLMALCLASEADEHDGNSVGDTFRDVAAGITLLERRATRQSPTRETIILATG